MRKPYRHLPWLGLLLVGFALGCGPKKDDTLVTSPAQQASYAARYPDALEATVKEFNDREEEANAVLSEVPNFPGALSDPDWNQALEVIDASVQAGRSRAYADRLREVRHVHAFYEAEKEELHRRAGGAAQYVAKQGGCSAQVGGAVGPALKKAIDKQLEKRLRERNEAHLLIVRYADSLGSKNAEALAQQADQLSYATYITFIELPETLRRLEAMVEEAEAVQETADRFIAEEEAFQQGPDRTDAEKQASAARVAAMKDAKSKAAEAAEQAKKMSEQMKERIEKLQKDFDYIVGALRAELTQRAPKK
ncbi:MAG: hypothetical protein ACOC1F_06215 [Myxococcota bacterium]